MKAQLAKLFTRWTFFGKFDIYSEFKEWDPTRTIGLSFGDNIPLDLTHFPNIKELELYDLIYDKMNHIQYLTMLTSLSFEYDRRPTAHPFPPSIQKLGIGEMTSNMLQGLTNLTDLSFGYSATITDDVLKVHPLKYLHIGGSAESNIFSFSNFPQLTNFSFPDGGIKFSKGDYTKNLSLLDCDKIYGSAYVDLTGLKDFCSNGLDIDNINKMKLTSLTKLVYLHHYDGDCYCTPELPNLIDLTTCSGSLKYFATISSIKSLKVTTCSNHAVNIYRIADFTQLVKLNLDLRDEADITLLDALINLTSLEINSSPVHKNKFTCYSFNKLVHLKLLDLELGKEGLVTLTNLRYLHLSNCTPAILLKDICKLSQLAYLSITDLKCDYDKAKKKFPHLQVFDSAEVSFNYINFDFGISKTY